MNQDYVDASEYFWNQQRPPTAEEMKSISERPHPYVWAFKKLSVLPSFVVSKVIGKQLSVEVAEASYSSNNGDNDNEIPALQLRGYQL